MGKNTSKTKYETVVQLIVLAAAISTPFLASMFMDLELFSVSKSMFITFCSSIKPWLCPPYVYLLINFIIFFIVASSCIRSNTIVFDPTTIHNHNDDHNQSFIESSIVCQSHVPGSSLSDHDMKFDHKLEADKKPDMFKDRENDPNSRKVVSESVVDKRELRKSKTFNECGSRHQIRRERYVRILSQEELDRRVEAFIYKFKKENGV